MMLRAFLLLCGSEYAKTPVVKKGKTTPPAPESGLSIRDIYERIYAGIGKHRDEITGEINREFECAKGTFTDVPERERGKLQQLELICRMSADIYFRKLFIERLLDQEQLRESGKETTEQGK